jgi:hypothetical protein
MRIVAGAFLFDLVACLLWAPPLLPFLLVAAALHWYSAGREQLLAKVAGDLAAPLLVGLTLVSLALLGLNAFSAVVDPAQVHAAEERLAEIRLAIAEWTDLSLGGLLIFGTALLALAVLVLSIDVVERVKQAQAAIGFLQTVLLVVTSFAIYAQAPLQTAVARTHDRVVRQYRAAVHREWSADARTASANTVRHSLQRLIAQHTTRQLADLTAAIKAREDASRTRVGRVVLGLEHSQPTGETGTLEERTVIDPTPKTRDQQAAQAAATQAREQQATRSERRAERAVSAALLLLPKLASLGVQIDPEALKVAFDALVDRFAEAKDAVVRRLFLSTERRRGAPVDELPSRALERIEPDTTVQDLLRERAGSAEPVEAP